MTDPEIVKALVVLLRRALEGMEIPDDDKCVLELGYYGDDAEGGYEVAHGEELNAALTILRAEKGDAT